MREQRTPRAERATTPRVLEKLGMRFLKRVEDRPLPLLYFELTRGEA
jgi:hypothetical protein